LPGSRRSSIALSPTSGTTYSVIGGGFSSAVGDSAGMATTAQALTSVALDTLRELPNAEMRRVHWGVKTEWGRQRGIRNYCSVVESVAPSVLAVLPGKFSLCFTAASKVAKMLGVAGQPSAFPRGAAGLDVSNYLARTRHDAVVLEHLAAPRRPPTETGIIEQVAA
jgi:hypothetical protein